MLNPYIDHIGNPGSSIWVSFLGRGVLSENTESPRSALIDLNDTVPAGGTWNTIGSTSASNVALTAADGSSTGWSASFGGWRTSSIVGNLGAFEGTVFEEGMEDYFFVQNSEVGTITISGLDPAKTYLVELASSRATGSATNRGGTFTVGENAADSDLDGSDFHARWDGYDIGSPITWETAAPNAQGELTIALTAGSRPGTTVYAYLNAVRISENIEPGWGISFYRNSFAHNDRVLFVGKGAGEESGFYGEAPGGWKIEGGLGSNTQTAYSSVPYDDLSLFVLKIDYIDNGNQIARLFHNPTLNGTAPADETAIATIETTLGSFGFDRIRIDGLGSGFEIDELRIGSTWEAVTSGETVSPPDGFAAWQEQFFPDQTDPAVRGPLADASGDGIPNLLKYALGLDPTIASRDNLPASGIGEFSEGSETAAYLTLEFTAAANTQDVTLDVRVFGDLGGGTSETAVLESTTVNGDSTTTYLYRDRQPINSSERRFMQLEVQLVD